MKANYFLYTMILTAIITSCSPSLDYYTARVHQDMNLSDTELQSVQFYLSHDIVLYRELGTHQTQIANGKIKFVDGQKVEEIIFPRETPGVVLFSPKADRLAVSFDDGDDSYLMFGPKPKAGGRYVLLGKEWNKRSGLITYRGESWRTSTRSALASLLVDIDKARKVQRKSERVKGRRI